MGSSKVVYQRTFVLKLNLMCPCEYHGKKVRKLVEKIHGVEEVSIDSEQGQATISGSVEPHEVIKVLEIEGKKLVINVELLDSGEEQIPPPPIINHHQLELQVVSHQKPVPTIREHRKVAHQPDVALKALDEPIANKTQNFYRKHGHPLELKSCNKPFPCDGCKEEGLRLRYRCEPCNYDLHEECMNPKSTITHEYFPRATFEYRHNPSNKVCDACGRKIHGISYHCREKNLNLHPRCSKLKRNLCIGGTDFVLSDKVQSKCFWCKKKQPSWLVEKKVQGLCYVSTCKKFYCHVYCISRMVHDAWKRGDLDGADDGDDDTSLALERFDLQLVARSNKSGGGGGVEFLRKIGIFIRTIVGILFGDPTVVLLTLLVEAIPR